jgi:hypothetical protein
MNTIMSDYERQYVCFHEAGHAAMFFWRSESLHERRIVIHTARFGGSTIVQCWDLCESDLMMLIGGPLAELLSVGIVPQKAIRFAREYRYANSDSTRIRSLVRKLRDGKDDRRYQFRVQERVREILQRPDMWRAVSSVAARLFSEGAIRGEDVEEIFEGIGVQNRFSQNLASLQANCTIKHV